MNETTVRTMIAVEDVKVGDVLRSRDGTEMTVTRIDPSFALREGMIAFVEDRSASGSRCRRSPALR